MSEMKYHPVDEQTHSFAFQGACKIVFIAFLSYKVVKGLSAAVNDVCWVLFSRIV